LSLIAIWSPRPSSLAVESNAANSLNQKSKAIIEQFTLGLLTTKLLLLICLSMVYVNDIN